MTTRDKSQSENISESTLNVLQLSACSFMSPLTSGVTSNEIIFTRDFHIMDSIWLSFLLSLMISSSGHSATTEPPCRSFGLEEFWLIEGESFYFVPLSVEEDILHEEFSWYKTGPQTESISSDMKKRIHYSGGALFLLNVTSEDAGTYSGVHKDSTGSCSEYVVQFYIFEQNQRANESILYGESNEMGVNKLVCCPSPVKAICDDLGGSFTWYMNFTTPLHGDEHELWVNDAGKEHEGIYTCVCTWKYNNRFYNSSGSRWLVVADITVHRGPEIISPGYQEQIVDQGTEQKLNCTILCGTRAHFCNAKWEIDGVFYNNTEGYTQTFDKSLMKETHSTAILTIKQVSPKHFQTQFVCVADGLYSTKYAAVTLKQRETIIPLVIGGVCSLFICVLVAALVHCFAIDLALLFRPYLPLSSHDKDEKIYDAYVVYQIQSGDKATEDTLCTFVSKILPSILEEKCGYRLFIHGRDDIPGEDCLELVEDRMRLSRRLMVILTPNLELESEIKDRHSTSVSPINTVVGGFDWQLGVHHALVQRDISVILIQLGDTGAQIYKHLPPGLQHLIQKSAPIRWSEDTKGAASLSSRFWKKVRYLMPARPASQSPRSAV